jgi:hypothetical protein
VLHHDDHHFSDTTSNLRSNGTGLTVIKPLCKE